MISSEWPRMTIQSLIASGAIIAHKDGNYGSLYPRVEEFGTAGVPFLTAKSIINGNVDIDGAPRLAEERADSLRFGFVLPSDVLLSHNATIGRVAIVPDFHGRLLVGTSLTYFRLDPTKLLPRYFAAYLEGVDFQNQLAAVMSHSTRNQVPITAQRALSVIVPPLNVQEMIAGTLGALDDKIEHNRRTSAALERLARAVFRAWFVDFEPVKAKAGGAASFASMPQEIFNALPSRLVDSELGAMPEGWMIEPLSSQCKIVSGGTPKRSVERYWGGGIPWFSVKDAPGNHTVWVYDTDEHITEEGLDNSAAQLVPKGCAIISARGTVGKLALAGQQMAFNQSCYGLLSSGESSYSYLFLALREVVGELQQRTHGSVFDTITRATFDGLKVVAPPGKVASGFHLAVEPLFELMLVFARESLGLAELRDYLLPRLLSGQVRAGVINAGK